MKVVWGPCAGACGPGRRRAAPLVTRMCISVSLKEGSVSVPTLPGPGTLSFLGSPGKENEASGYSILPESKLGAMQSRPLLWPQPLAGKMKADPSVHGPGQAVLTLPSAPDPDCGRLCLCPSLCLTVPLGGALPTGSSSSGEVPALPKLQGTLAQVGTHGHK